MLQPRTLGQTGAWIGCLCLLGWPVMAVAAIRLPNMFGDHMVLQRDQPVPVWGWADPSEMIVVEVAGQKAATRAEDDGRWKVEFASLDVGPPSDLTITDSSGEFITIKDVLVGEVWLCSGQSNMQWTFNGDQGVMNNDAEVLAAQYPNIRMFTVARTAAAQPASDVGGDWLPITPDNLRVGGCDGASALAYFFGRELHQRLGSPIGLINASVGGTAAERWTSHEALEAQPTLQSLSGEDGASTLYNGMIAPWIPFAIRGVIWYQGEDNTARAYQYRTLFPTMIAQWRADWGQGDFPFGFVQLAPCRYKPLSPQCCAELREAQTMTLQSTPNTGMAVTMDIGDAENIHPKNKQEVGRRLALWAMAKVYGRDVAYSGPIYQAMTVEGDRIRLIFIHVNSGLASSDGQPLREFTIAGADRRFVEAQAEIDGPTIVVRSNRIAEPIAVRYAWRDDATPNFANQDGLPASPFRTDDWKGVTEP